MLQDLLLYRSDCDKAAIIQADRILTYRQWSCQARALADIIRHLPCGPCGAVFLPNSIEYAVSYFAILLTGGIVVPSGVQAKGPELCAILAYCEADYIITDATHAEMLVEHLRDYLYCIALIEADTGLVTLLHAQCDYVPKSGAPLQTGGETDVAVMLHTSGTTSDPKRVMLTHSGLLANIEANIHSLHLAENDRVLIALPMHFGYCNTAQFLTHLFLGATMVLLQGHFFPKRFFQIIEKEKITNFTAVPSMLLPLLEYPHAERYDLSSLRLVCFGGGKMPLAPLQQLIERFDRIGWVQTYGQTEAGPRITALLPFDALRKLGSVGKPIPGVQLEIHDDLEKALTEGEIGEVVVRSPGLMRGYYKKEQLTGQTLANGWLHTGDWGYLDSEGYLYLTGRIKNLIITGGLNIYPEEVEEILCLHEDVIEALVCAKPDELLGELPIAKVICAVGASVTAQQLTDHCLSKISAYKVPVQIDFVSHLDKTYNGKLKRTTAPV